MLKQNHEPKFVFGICPACQTEIKRKFPSEIAVCPFCLSEIRLYPQNPHNPAAEKNRIIMHRQKKMKIPKNNIKR